MKELSNYIIESDLNESEPVNEGFLMNAATKSTLRRMDPDDLLNGLLNMYDYIVDNDDINLFYKDFNVKEQLFWKNLYNLYSKKVWSIVDMEVSVKDVLNAKGNNDDGLKGNEELLKRITPELNKVVDVTVEFRRNLRQIIKQSKNDELELKPSEPESLIAIADKLLDKVYILTINRTTGLRSIFRPIDAKFLKEVFEKIGLAGRK